MKSFSFGKAQKKKNGNKKFKCEDGNFLVVCPLIVILELI